MISIREENVSIKDKNNGSDMREAKQAVLGINLSDFIHCVLYQVLPWRCTLLLLSNSFLHKTCFSTSLCSPQCIYQKY